MKMNSRDRSRSRSGEDTTPRTHRGSRSVESVSRRRPPLRMQDIGTVTRDDIWRELRILNEKVDTISVKIDEKLDLLLEKVENMVTKTPNSKIPPQLSALVRQTHRTLGEQLQWKVRPTDNFRSTHNEEVTTAVLQAIKDMEPEWSHHQIRRACNRAYESLKSVQRMEREGNKEDVMRRKVLTSRRDRLFKKRVKVGEKVLNRDDLAYLKGANANFVSDEESDEDKTVYTFSSPKWRATQLTRVMSICQKALDENRKKAVEPRSTHLRRPADGHFSKRLPPAAEGKSLYIKEHSEEEEGEVAQ